MAMKWLRRNDYFGMINLLTYLRNDYVTHQSGKFFGSKNPPTENWCTYLLYQKTSTHQFWELTFGANNF